MLQHQNTHTSTSAGPSLVCSCSWQETSPTVVTGELHRTPWRSPQHRENSTLTHWATSCTDTLPPPAPPSLSLHQLTSLFFPHASTCLCSFTRLLVWCLSSSEDATVSRLFPAALWGQRSSKSSIKLRDTHVTVTRSVYWQQPDDTCHDTGVTVRYIRILL